MERVSIGYPFTLVPNEIYALPGTRCMLFCDNDKIPLQQSTDAVFTADEHITLTDGMCEISGGFIRNVAAIDALVMLKRF